ncbi:MAG: nickel pincer cofactor biosynthesis protein LarB, partial [Candidatus Bathyarchaeia archaeon]
NIENFAQLDVDRTLRRGLPEIVLAENKSPEDTARIAVEMARHTSSALVTRATPAHVEAMKKLSGEMDVQIHERARTVVVRQHGYMPPSTGGRVGILTAGTADIPVAEEARVVAEEMGCAVSTHYDVGIAGLHRLFTPLKKLVEAEVDALVVAAGMEGALPSVVASLSDIPVIGIPTSSGYGYGGAGAGALMSMLQSCSLGLAVVNIDNGVAAGAYAALIANRAAKGRSKTAPST